MSYVLKSVIFYFFIFFNFYTTAIANITDYRFYAGQVHDAQRYPVFPIANSSFSLTQLQDPYRENSTQYSLNNGEYIKFFYVGGFCNDGLVGINYYSAQGKFLEVVQSGGHIYGLAPEGFLFDNDKNIGTFISTRPLHNTDNVTYVPSTGPYPETCANLENYVKYISY